MHNYIYTFKGNILRFNKSVEVIELETEADSYKAAVNNIKYQAKQRLNLMAATNISLDGKLYEYDKTANMITKEFSIKYDDIKELKKPIKILNNNIKLRYLLYENDEEPIEITNNVYKRDNFTLVYNEIEYRTNDEDDNKYYDYRNMDNYIIEIID